MKPLENLQDSFAADSLTLDDVLRFRTKYGILPSGCWGWLGHLSSVGYGSFNAGGRTWGAHRFAYVVAIADVYEGMDIHHVCRLRACVNPEHLEALPYSVHRSLPHTGEPMPDYPYEVRLQRIEPGSIRHTTKWYTK
jgi:hypothetical protein